MCIRDSGKSEEQVVEELGSPRLIARSIIDAHGIEESASGNSDYGDNSYGSGYAQNDSSYRSQGDAYSDRRDIENNNQKGALQSAGTVSYTHLYRQRKTRVKKRYNQKKRDNLK